MVDPSRNRRGTNPLVFLGLASAGLIGALLLFSWRQDDDPSRSPNARPQLRVNRGPSSSSDSTLHPSAHQGSSALPRLVTQAEDLRRQALANPEFLRQLVVQLADPLTPMATRRLIALVLGTIPDPEAQGALVNVLRSSQDASFKRLILLALGAFKTRAAVSGLFRQGGPYVIEFEGGLSLVIKTELRDDGIRSEVLKHLLDADPAVRAAVVLASRFSTSFPEVRQGLLSIADSRADTDEARMASAGSLADWSGTQSAESADRQQVCSVLLSLGVQPDEIGIRLATQTGLEQAPLSPLELERVSDVLRTSQDLGTVTWGLGLLSSKAGEDLDGDARTLSLITTLVSNTDPKIRENAVRSAGSYSGVSAEALLQKGLTDPEWHVRFAACQALREGEATPRRLQLIESARKDRDPRVAAAAEKTYLEIQSRMKD